MDKRDRKTTKKGTPRTFLAWVDKWNLARFLEGDDAYDLLLMAKSKVANSDVRIAVTVKGTDIHHD